MENTALEKEWALLQNQFDSYEKYSLLIKLVNTSLLSVAYFSNNTSIFVGILLLTLWLQDGIWKTFQSRIENRLLQIEDNLAKDQTLKTQLMKAYQFNSQFKQNRVNPVLLIIEYLKQALRPTIAFPYVILVALLAYELLS